MRTTWPQDAYVEVYNFEGENWRRARVLDPEYEIDGYTYLWVRWTEPGPDEPSVMWIAPELVQEHVRAAS